MPSYRKKPSRSEKLRRMAELQAKRIDEHRERKDLVHDQYNILKLLNHVFIDAKNSYNIDQRQLMFLFFVYDLEIFSIRYTMSAFGYTGRFDNFMDMVVQPMVDGGHLKQYSPAQDYDLPIINARNNKQTARFNISIAGRRVVKRYLDKIHGRIPIMVDEKTHFRMFLESQDSL
jgi:hypothetical protein